MRFFDFAASIDELPGEGLRTLPSRVWPFLWFFLRQIQARFWALVALGVVAGTLSALAPYFFGHIIAAFVTTTDRALIWDNLAWPLGTYVVFVLVLAPALYNTQGWLGSRTQPYFAALVRRQLGIYLHSHSYRFFQDDFAGRLAGKVLEMPNAMRMILGDITGPFVFAGVTFLTTLAVFAGIGWSFTVFTALYIALYFVNLRFYIPRIQHLSQVASRARSIMRGRFVDIVSNILLVKIFARAGHEDRYFRDALHANASAASAQDVTVTRMFRVQHVLNSGFMLALIFATLHAWRQGDMDTAQISMVLPLALNMVQATFWLTEIYTGFFERIGEVEEGMEAIVHAHDIQDKPNAPALVVREPAITFDGVTFAYPGRTIFEHFTLHIPARQRVGLVGPSGAGKSTLVQLLLRLHDIQSGRILIDGQDIASITQDSLRDAIGVIPQMADLLHRSVRDNIRYGDLDAHDDHIMDAAVLAQAHGFIGGLRDTKGGEGYDAMVGERGVKLSGGQRQRVAIARAVIKDAPIIILDEATASLDSESERLIQQSMEKLMQGRTVLAIAHRLSTIASLDRLVVMQNGRIVEDGRHADLLTRNGVYARLWSLQSGGFLPEN